MVKLGNLTISKIDKVTFGYEKLILDRLKLFDFAKSAIGEYCLSKADQLKGYDFQNFKGRFQTIKFRADREIKSIKYDQMVNIGNGFIESELSDAIFVLNIANFEQWILEILKIMIMQNPDMFEGDKKIDLSMIRESVDLDNLWERIVERYLIGLPYDGMKKMIERVVKIFEINKSVITTDHIGKINEYSQCRNLIVHNHKIVNEAYVRKSGKFARYKQGDSISINEKILFDEGDALLRFMQDIRNYLGKKVKKNP
ncbi:MAG: hypothetical protein NTW12_13660 [Deltaproteobacteria bacterium]|nr:hypothetical protein [Deltaproteobacteria bacterium]